MDNEEKTNRDQILWWTCPAEHRYHTTSTHLFCCVRWFHYTPSILGVDQDCRSTVQKTGRKRTYGHNPIVYSNNIILWQYRKTIARSNEVTRSELRFSPPYLNPPSSTCQLSEGSLCDVRNIFWLRFWCNGDSRYAGLYNWCLSFTSPCYHNDLNHGGLQVPCTIAVPRTSHDLQCSGSVHTQ